MPPRTIFATVALLLFASGCQHIQLQRRTLAQASTLTDIQYTEVLSNLAMFATNPDAMPFYSSTNTGINTNQQSGELNPSFGWDLLVNATTFRFDKIGAGFRASRTSTGQWSTVSVLNPDQLALMRCAYQKTLGFENEDCDKRLQEFFASRPEFMVSMQPGWFCVCKRSQVPDRAAYVGCYKDVYVWVKPGGENDLTLLTLAILDLANPSTVGRGKPKRDERIKYYQEEAKAIVDVLSKTPDEGAPEVIKLKSNLENHTLKQLNLLLAQEGESLSKTSRPSYETMQGFRDSNTEAAPIEDEEDLIRPRPVIIPYSGPPNIIPIPQ